MKRAHTEDSLCVCPPTTHIAEWKLASGMAEGILQLAPVAIFWENAKSVRIVKTGTKKPLFLDQDVTYIRRIPMTP